MSPISYEEAILLCEKSGVEKGRMEISFHENEKRSEGVRKWGKMKLMGMGGVILAGGVLGAGSIPGIIFGGWLGLVGAASVSIGEEYFKRSKKMKDKIRNGLIGSLMTCGKMTAITVDLGVVAIGSVISFGLILPASFVVGKINRNAANALTSSVDDFLKGESDVHGKILESIEAKDMELCSLDLVENCVNDALGRFFFNQNRNTNKDDFFKRLENVTREKIKEESVFARFSGFAKTDGGLSIGDYCSLLIARGDLRKEGYDNLYALAASKEVDTLTSSLVEGEKKERMKRRI